MITPNTASSFPALNGGACRAPGQYAVVDPAGDLQTDAMAAVAESVPSASDDQRELTDLHLNIDDPERSMVFPGPRHVSDSLLPMVYGLIERATSISKDDFMVVWQDKFFRGRRDRQAVDGVWLRLRRMASVPPTLDTLPSPMPPVLRQMLMSGVLLSGGLVYIMGAPGSGKTTSCSAAVVSRLLKYGGFAYTVEDPPEMPLNGWHGEGYCSQTWVPGDAHADWHDAFRGVLRSQPARTPCILFVGEVRDRESASALIRAASSGFLVFATGFGTDIPSAIDTLVRLGAGDNDSKMFQDAAANILRLVIHQRIINNRLTARALASLNGRTSVAAKIRDGRYVHLEADIQFQANQMLSGIDVFEDQSRSWA